jgi:hypothetical protein
LQQAGGGSLSPLGDGTGAGGYPHSAWFWGSGIEIDGEIIPHAFMFDNLPPE